MILSTFRCDEPCFPRARLFSWIQKKCVIFLRVHRKTAVLEDFLINSQCVQRMQLKIVCNFIKDTPTGLFPVNIAKFLRTAFFIEHLRWLHLNR